MAEEDDGPIDLLGIKHDLGQTISLGKVSHQEALEVLKNLGSARSLPKVAQYFKNQGRKAPGLNTMKAWKIKYNWKFHVNEYDVDVAKRTDDKIKEQYAEEAAEDLSNLASKMRKVSNKMLNRLDKAISTLVIKSGGEAKAVAEAAVALNKSAEVLDGGVSDRTETTMTVDERKNAAADMVSGIFKQFRRGGNDNRTRIRTGTDPVGDAGDAGSSGGSLQKNAG